MTRSCLLTTAKRKTSSAALTLMHTICTYAPVCEYANMYTKHTKPAMITGGPEQIRIHERPHVVCRGSRVLRHAQWIHRSALACLCAHMFLRVRVRVRVSLKGPPTYPPGEDGFEITITNDESAQDIAARLLAEDEARVERVPVPYPMLLLLLLL